ncbi:MAG: 6-carboxytetrahydropterin synthase [Desulfobacterales bacterium]|jgi:6-pyruvoyltetrahydropterin/6-carboxytetrahydropterin synthase
MYTLVLQRDFTASHFLIGGDWGEENHPHEHPYRVEVHLHGRRLDAHGYLVDLDRLETVLEECVFRYRGRSLNALPEFQGVNPSLENFAKRFFDALFQQLGHHSLEGGEIRIWENEAAWASYREAF